MTIKWVQAVFCRMIFLFEAELCLVLNNILPNAKKRQGKERKINEQINIYFSAIKTRALTEVWLQERKKWFCLLSLIVYHIHLFERANQERQREAWHSWFQSIRVIFLRSVYFTRSLFTVPDGRVVGPLPSIWALVRNQLSTLSHPLLRHQGSATPRAGISSSGHFCTGRFFGKPRYPRTVITAPWVPACAPAWTHTHMTHPPTPTAGNLSPINNSLLPIRNICGTVKTFLLHLQRGRLLMFYRLWKPSRIKHYLKFSWVGVGKVGAFFGETFSLKTAVGFCSKRECDNIKM